MANNLRFQSDSSLTSVNQRRPFPFHFAKAARTAPAADLSKELEKRSLRRLSSLRKHSVPASFQATQIPPPAQRQASASSFTNFSLPPKSVKAPATVGAAGYPLTAALVSQNELAFESCFSSTAPF